jgi:hypothetical protein
VPLDGHLRWLGPRSISILTFACYAPSVKCKTMGMNYGFFDADEFRRPLQGPNGRSSINGSERCASCITLARSYDEQMTRKRRRLTCRDYLRMPLCQAFLEHIEACPSRRTSVNGMPNDLDCRACGREHRD